MARVRTKITFGLILIALVTLCFTCFQPISAQNHTIATIKEDGSINAIIINEDSSIKPSTAPILREGTIYTLTNDINGMIVISKSNITLNGNGHTINQYASFQDNSNAHGIFLSQVFNVTVANTTIINSGNGIYAIQNPTAGIYVNGGGSNVIIANNLVNNYNGLLLSETNDNVISQNNLTNSNNPYGVGYGILLWGSSNNEIFQNNFIDNRSPAQVTNSASQSHNSWDNGKEGNFWDDYTGTDANNDGTGDTPYEIKTNNKSGALFPKNTDSYPLIQLFNSALHLLKTTPPKIEVLSPLNEVYNESIVSLTFVTDKALVSVTYNIDEALNQTIAGNLTLPELPNGLHNLTIYAKDTYGNNASQTVDFSILVPESSENTVPIAVVILLLAIAVCVVSVLLFSRHRKTSNLK